jgi:hypothetical protein
MLPGGDLGDRVAFQDGDATARARDLEPIGAVADAKHRAAHDDLARSGDDGELLLRRAALEANSHGAGDVEPNRAGVERGERERRVGAEGERAVGVELHGDAGAGAGRERVAGFDQGVELEGRAVEGDVAGRDGDHAEHRFGGRQRRRRRRGLGRRRGRHGAGVVGGGLVAEQRVSGGAGGGRRNGRGGEDPRAAPCPGVHAAIGRGLPVDLRADVIPAHVHGLVLGHREHRLARVPDAGASVGAARALADVRVDDRALARRQRARVGVGEAMRWDVAAHDSASWARRS